MRFWGSDLAPSGVVHAPQSSILNVFFRPQRWILARGLRQEEETSLVLGASLPAPPEGMNPIDIVAWRHSSGGFEIRPVDRSMDEIKAVASLQGRSFFQSPSWGPAFLSTVALQSTTAEALDALSQNLRYTPKDKFACLVVKLSFERQRTRSNSPRDVEESQDQKKQKNMKKRDIIGVVHLGVQSSAAVIADIKKHDPTNDSTLRKSQKGSKKRGEVVSVTGNGVSNSPDNGASGTHGDALVEEYAYLSSMAVEEGMRGKGVAKFMVQSIGRLAQAWQFNFVFLHVKAANTKAVRLYETVGFEEVSRRKVGGLVGGEDQLLMRCVVSKLVDLDPLQPL